MVLRWSTSKNVFSDPDLGSKWPPSADIVLTCMFAEGGHLGWRSGSLDTILKIDHLRTIHAMFALNWLTGFREEDFLNIFPNPGV
jgi:predicted alpha/beta-fold hydrolase